MIIIFKLVSKYKPSGDQPKAIKELVKVILAHNKTLAGQLYSEFKELFPENRVEYFVSYYENISNPVLFSTI